ncbi:MAG: hypothetical protein ABF633_10325 [Clostridium sp.]|uniref:hypothetical protein n=1 Tax=Clostridium sp. TaxID=1506 RepID=UPI0039E830F0
MKTANKSIIAWIIAIIVVAGIGIIIYKNNYNIDSTSYLSSKNDSGKSFDINENYKIITNSESFDFTKFNGKWSLIEFNSSKNNKITIEDNTKITKGKFYIIVLDSNYNIVVKKNESIDKGNINFTTPKDGKYIIRIAGENTNGTFNIKIDSANKIDISHKDFFS